MCGIVGAIAEREVSEILLEGLKRLEYRGYDSAGMALLNESKEKVEVLKAVGVSVNPSIVHCLVCSPTLPPDPLSTPCWNYSM